MLPSIVIFLLDCLVISTPSPDAPAAFASSVAGAACKDSSVTTGLIGAFVLNQGCSQISSKSIRYYGLGFNSFEIKSLATLEKLRGHWIL